MLSDRCLSVCLVLSVTLVYCGQTVGWITMKLGMQVGLGPGHIVVDWDPAPPSPKRALPPSFRPISVVAKWMDVWRRPWYGSRPRPRPHCVKERKSIYIVHFWPRRYTQSARSWITQFYLQITPCLPFLRERSPDGTTTTTEAADIQLQLTTHLSTQKGWQAELAWLVDL